MKYTKQSLGRPATFLLPSLKLQQEWVGVRKKVAQVVEEHLLEYYGGYTAAAGNIFGEWRANTGKIFYGEHREYSVAFVGKEKIPHLEKFLATVAFIINEECIYMTTGEDAWLIYPRKGAEYE